MTSIFLAAVALMGLGIATAAMRHKSLLDSRVQAELLARLGKLTAETRGRWGRMGAGQMLRHVAGGLRMATGDLDIPPRGGLLRRFPIKQLIIFVLPFPKGAPTAPALVCLDPVDFEVERDAVRALLQSFAKRDLAHWPEHPAFGPLNRKQWGVLVWKHVDHHFRQFGV